MINNFKKILVLSCLIFLTNCGYTPLLNSEKNNLIGPIKTNRGYGLVKILEISTFDSTNWTSQKNIIKTDLNRIKETTNYQNWMSNLKENAEIVDNRKFYF